MLLLAESDLHLLICISYVKKIPQKEYVIIWLGNSQSFAFNYFEKFYNIKNLETSGLNFFNVEKINSWYNSNIHIDVRILATFYDTHYIFEYLKFKLDIKWKNVYLIDDGIGSLFRVSMPKLFRRIPKAVYNLFLCRFGVNLSYYSLGSNKKIENFITIFPIFLNFENLESRIEDVQDYFKQSLKELSLSFFKDDEFRFVSGSIITLSPVLKYKRQTPQYVSEYLKDLINYCDKSLPIYLKPHPRDDKEKLKEVLSQLDYPVQIINSPVPLELFFENMENAMLIGMPSTSFCIASLLYTNASSKILICREKNDPFPKRIAVLESIFKSQNTNYEIL